MISIYQKVLISKWRKLKNRPGRLYWRSNRNLHMKFGKAIAIVVNGTTRHEFFTLRAVEGLIDDLTRGD